MELNLKDVKTIHVIAICGMGMGSLAGMLKSRDYVITGSDVDVYPPMSVQLQEMGIEVKEGYRPENLEPQPDLVIVGNAVSRNNAEVQAMLAKGLPYLSFPQALREFFLHGKHPVVITGTHGKTSTSALTAWLLESGGKPPGFMIGGILRNYDRSYQAGNGSYFVVEGDEYDSAFFDKRPKFLHYRPGTAILTSIEYDHADIYPNLEAVVEAFSQFVAGIPSEGLLLACGEDPLVKKVVHEAPCQVETYGLNGSDFCWGASRVTFDETGARFLLLRKSEEVGWFQSPLWGRHNLLNVLGAIGAAHHLGVRWEDIRIGLARFLGVKKRQEVRGEARGVIVLDDFAHHPSAVRETIAAVRFRFPGRRLWAVFEPRTNTSRRKIFQEAYAHSFDQADQVIVTDVNHPQKVPIQERFSSEQLVCDLRIRGKEVHHISGTQGIVDHLASSLKPSDVILFMSNGDFDGIHEKVLSRLREP